MNQERTKRRKVLPNGTKRSSCFFPVCSNYIKFAFLFSNLCLLCGRVTESSQLGSMQGPLGRLVVTKGGSIGMLLSKLRREVNSGWDSAKGEKTQMD